MNKTNRDYLNELKNEHTVVERLLEDIKGYIQANDMKGVTSRMDSLKNDLLSHIGKEDDKIYTELIKVAKEKKIELIEITVNTFSTAMKGVASRALKVFDKYSSTTKGINIPPAEIHKDFQGIQEDILKRINNEEKVLYPMYERYCC